MAIFWFYLLVFGLFTDLSSKSLDTNFVFKASYIIH